MREIARSHEAADRDLPPQELVPYHEQCQRFEDVQFMDTMVGRALREWNSPAGVSTEACNLIMESNVYCPGCDRMFSVDGLHGHANHNGICDKGRKPLAVRQLPVSDSMALFISRCLRLIFSIAHSRAPHP